MLFVIHWDSLFRFHLLRHTKQPATYTHDLISSEPTINTTV